MFALLLVIGVWITAMTSATTTCLLTQPRPKGAPSSTLISQALHEVLSTHKLCSATFPTLPNGSLGNSIRRSTGSLVLEISRTKDSIHLDHTCVDAFNKIIYECVRSKNYWGGNATATGLEYTIFNEAYPANWKPASSASHVAALPVPHSISVPLHAPTHKAAKLPSSHPAPAPAPASKHPLSSSQHHVNTVAHAASRSKVATPKTPVSVTAVNAKAWSTKTLSGVTGSPSSFSQTKTTDSKGHPTVLPIWFDALGVAILVAPVAAAGGVLVPPPPGFPALSIGPDGQAHPVEHGQASPVEHQYQRPTQNHETPTPTVSSRHSSSARSSSHTSSSSPTISAASTLQMIFPKDRKDPANSALTSELTRIFGAQNVRVVETPGAGIWVWEAYLSQEQITHYRANPLVDSIEAEVSSEESFVDDPDTNVTETVDSHIQEQHFKSTSIRGRDTGRTLQSFTGQMAELSQGPGTTPFTYEYDMAAGQGISIYVHDTGANLGHDDFQKRDTRWLFVQNLDRNPLVRLALNKKNDLNGHGTCMVSKAAGTIYGSAKKASIVIVKNTSLDSGGLLAGLNLIESDIRGKKLQGKAVINISFNTWNPGKNYERALADLIRVILDLGAVFVCSSGNRGGYINSYPAFLAASSPVIAVGAVDQNGETSVFPPIGYSQGGAALTVSSLGSNVICADKSGSSSVRRASGTSVASATVAGLAAYFLSVPSFQSELRTGALGDTAARVKALIERLAWVRKWGGDKVAYNGEGPQACVKSSGKQKRLACATTQPNAAASSVVSKAVGLGLSVGAALGAVTPAPKTTSVPMPSPQQLDALPPSEKSPGWGPNNPSTCIFSPGCANPEMNAIFQRALSHIPFTTFFTAYTAISSNFVENNMGLPATDGGLISYKCPSEQAYHDGVVSGADVYNAAQMIRSWGCDTCGIHVLGPSNCTVMLGYCKAGDCNDVIP